MRRSPLAQIRWAIAALALSPLPAVGSAQDPPVPPASQLPVQAPWALSAPPASADTAPIELQPTNPANPNDSPAMRALILDVIKRNEADKKDAEDKKKKEEDKKKEEEGYKVGTDLKMTARWDNGLKFETTNKDFIIQL